MRSSDATASSDLGIKVATLDRDAVGGSTGWMSAAALGIPKVRSSCYQQARGHAYGTQSGKGFPQSWSQNAGFPSRHPSSRTSGQRLAVLIDHVSVTQAVTPETIFGQRRSELIS